VRPFRLQSIRSQWFNEVHSNRGRTIKRRISRIAEKIKVAYREKISFPIAMIIASFFIIGIFAKDAMTEMPTVPPFEQALDWHPLPDRTLLVQFDNIAFRYEILDSKPAPDCQSILRLSSRYNHQLRWITNGFINHQYLTKGDPSFYKDIKHEDWLWMSIKTYTD